MVARVRGTWVSTQWRSRAKAVASRMGCGGQETRWNGAWRCAGERPEHRLTGTDAGVQQRHTAPWLETRRCSCRKRETYPIGSSRGPGSAVQHVCRGVGVERGYWHRSFGHPPPSSPEVQASNVAVADQRSVCPRPFQIERALSRLRKHMQWKLQRRWKVLVAGAGESAERPLSIAPHRATLAFHSWRAVPNPTSPRSPPWLSRSWQTISSLKPPIPSPWKKSQVSHRCPPHPSFNEAPWLVPPSVRSPTQC